MKNLKKFRLLAEKTQVETAQQLGVTQHTYSNYELGKTQADYETLIKLADYFHTTVDSLLGHEVPYLLDKSKLTPKQRNIINLVPLLSNEACDMAEGYISGLIDGERDRQAFFDRLRK